MKITKTKEQYDADLKRANEQIEKVDNKIISINRSLDKLHEKKAGVVRRKFRISKKIHDLECIRIFRERNKL